MTPTANEYFPAQHKMAPPTRTPTTIPTVIPHTHLAWTVTYFVVATITLHTIDTKMQPPKPNTNFSTPNSSFFIQP